MSRDSDPSSTWTCPACGEALEPQFDTCWNCGAERPDDQPVGDEPESAPAGESHAEETTDDDAAAPGPLSLRYLAELATKALALYLFAQAALGTGTLLFFVFTMVAVGAAATSGVALLGAVVPTGQFLVGWFLWAKADWLSRRMVGNKGGLIVSTTVASHDILLLAMTAAGVFVFIGGARSLVYVVAPATMSDYLNLADLWNVAQWRSDLLAAGLSIGLGIWLILGSQGVATLVHWLRNAGTTEEYARDDERMSASSE